MGFLQGFEYVTCLIYILWGVGRLDMDKSGRIEISKMIAAVQARNDDGSRGAE